jgi:hypothetical protein
VCWGFARFYISVVFGFWFLVFGFWFLQFVGRNHQCNRPGGLCQLPLLGGEFDCLNNATYLNA